MLRQYCAELAGGAGVDIAVVPCGGANQLAARRRNAGVEWFEIFANAAGHGSSGVL